jgi:threonine/homoserine/homoserine lactone efflux protein
VLIALLAGLGLGFAGSIPVAGPTAVVVVESALANRPRRGMAIAAGAAIAESLYALVAFWGLAAVLARYPMLRPVSRVVAGVILSLVGAYLAFRKPRLAARSERSEPKRHGHEILFGFSITALNPTLAVTWTVAVAALHSALGEWLTGSDAIPFALGAGIGIVGWFWLLLKIVCHFRMALAPETVNKIIRGTGSILIVAGLIMAARGLFKLTADVGPAAIVTSSIRRDAADGATRLRRRQPWSGRPSLPL